VVVFFVTFCYNRYFMIYDTARQVSSTILDVCVASRTFLPTEERRKLFIFLNLMHVSAYCALTPVYTKENFMDTFCKEHRIELPRDLHDAIFGKLDSGGDGASAYQLCCVWAMGVLHDSLQRKLIHGEELRVMVEEVLKSRSLLSSLFAYQYQVIPFVYAHLVSSGSFIYLLGISFVKAGKFRPDANIMDGLVLPLLSFLLCLVVTVGLIEIGQAIANPWGTDPEDFAVPTFLHTTAKCARVIIESETEDPLKGKHVDIGNPDLNHLASECNVSVDWMGEGARHLTDVPDEQRGLRFSFGPHAHAHPGASIPRPFAKIAEGGSFKRSSKRPLKVAPTPQPGQAYAAPDATDCLNEPST